ncbi:hypothetical protein T8S45_02815 [Blastomonas marina]|jgi:hypothetical protein|uniref:hypothetical protein n=1 Tax=Blastomonas marina TaxID=1867408 RepID=UPI002AC9A8CF|nr:hypothetical protein [Blastomonas marina]WPZ04488.1 hypothetical protein T8S45_02815 [Blastomonas marina]
MKKLLMTSVAAATAMAMAPNAMADDHMEMQVELTTQQQAMYDGWSDANRMAYDAWPADVQAYYWTLTPMQAEAWWQLTDEQRVAIFEMVPAQRAATWQSISQQMNKRSATTQSASSTNVRYQSGAVVQTVPANTVQGDYPICADGRTDACIQPRAAGKNWGNRPLDYWPGKPASEMDDDS